jgi:O-antigen ligase
MLVTVRQHLVAADMPLHAAGLACALALGALFFVDVLWVMVGLAAILLLIITAHPRSALLMLVVALPFSRLGIGIPRLPGVGVFDFYAVWFILVFFLHALVTDGGPTDRPRALRWGAVMLLAFLPSMTNAIELVPFIRGVLQIGFGLLIAYGIWSLVARSDHPDILPLLLRVLTHVTALFGAYGLYQTFTSRMIITMLSGRSSNALFGDPNYYACFLVMVLCIALALSSLERRRLWRVSAGYCALVLFVGILTTVSRAGYIATVVVMTGMIIFFFNHRRMRKQILWGAVIVATVAAVLTTATQLPSNIIRVFAMGDRVQMAVAGKDGSVNQRAKIFTVGTRIVASHPIIGVGFGNFEKWYDFYREGDLSTQNARAAHNTYLKMFAETGIIGLAAGLLFYCLLIGALVRALRSASAYRDKAILFGFIMALLAYFIMNVTLDQIYEAHFWVFAGLSMAAVRAITRPTLVPHSVHPYA